MQSSQEAIHVQLHVAEDGEMIGTAQQVANRLNLPRPKVWSCLQQKEATPVVLPSTEENKRVLIVDADGVDALLECATETKS